MWGNGRGRGACTELDGPAEETSGHRQRFQSSQDGSGVCRECRRKSEALRRIGIVNSVASSAKDPVRVRTEGRVSRISRVGVVGENPRRAWPQQVVWTSSPAWSAPVHSKTTFLWNPPRPHSAVPHVLLPRRNRLTGSSGMQGGRTGPCV